MYGIAAALALFSLLPAHAQTTCLAYPSNSTAPNGYGVSWDVFDSARRVIIEGDCDLTDENKVPVTIGSGDANQVVYKEMYSYKGGTEGWKPLSLHGTVNGDWISGSGSIDIAINSGTSAASPHYFVGYVCTNRGSAGWKCGCRDSACTEGYWQLQAYTGTPQSSEGGTTGGTTGGTGGGSGSGPLNDGIGTPLTNGGPGNHRFEDSVSKTILVEKIDSPITSVAWNNRSNSDRIGYSTGDGGEISIRVRKVNSMTIPSVGHGRISLGPVIGESAHIMGPVNPSGWNEQYRLAGGSGGATSAFSKIPTVTFKQPIDLAANGVKIGDHLAFEFIQHNPSRGTVSTNEAHAVSFWRGASRGFTKAMRDNRIFRANGNERSEKVSLMLVGYQDGTVVGNPWFQYANRTLEGSNFDFSGSRRIRQVVPMIASGKSVRTLHTMATRPGGGSDPLILELREAGSTPGGGSDEGTLLCSGSVPASASTQVSSGSNMKSDDFILKDQEVTCPSAVPLTKGKTYYIVARSGGSTEYRMSRLWRFTEGTNVGLQRPSYAVRGFTGQENTGSGWRDMQGGGESVDAPLFAGF